MVRGPRRLAPGRHRFPNCAHEQRYVIWYEAPDELRAREALFGTSSTSAGSPSPMRSWKSRRSSCRRPSGRWRWLRSGTQSSGISVPRRFGRSSPAGLAEATHISLLLDTAAGGPVGTARPLFHTFETLPELSRRAHQSLQDEGGRLATRVSCCKLQRHGHASNSRAWSWSRSGRSVGMTGKKQRRLGKLEDVAQE